MFLTKPQVSAVLLALAIGMGPPQVKELLVPPPGESGAYLAFVAGADLSSGLFLTLVDWLTW